MLAPGCAIGLGRAAIRLGAYQLLLGIPSHAAVGEAVEVVATRQRGYVNGVLRALPCRRNIVLCVCGMRNN